MRRMAWLRDLPSRERMTWRLRVLWLRLTGQIIRNPESGFGIREPE
jgi:hypothetical protein